MEKTYQFIFYDYKNDQFYNSFKYVTTDAEGYHYADCIFTSFTNILTPRVEPY